MKKFLLSTAVIACLAVPSCKKQDDPIHYFTGPTTQISSGTASAWIKTDERNQPESIGIVLDKNALAHMPTDGAGEFTYTLQLPDQKSLTPFDHIVLDWNPHGHPPAHVYDKPHFDMHFYMIGESERLAIPEYEQDSVGFLNYPAPGYVPANYVPIPGGEAKMGTHWADVTSPELNQSNPQPFTQTFIYGSFNGKVTFYEPMVTLDFLINTSSFTRDIPQPQKFAKDGFYPTQMSIIDKGATIEVSLHHFAFHAKS